MRKSNKQVKRPKNRLQNSSVKIFRPPQYNPPTQVLRTFRFVSNATTAVQVALADLLGMAGVVNVVPNTNLGLFDSVRLHSVECWTLGVPGNSIDLTFYTGNSQVEFMKPDEYTDQCTSTAAPAHIIARPPGNVFSSWLVYNSTQTISPRFFTIASSVGTVVDVTVSLTMAGAAGFSPAQYTSTAAGTIGTIYYLGLDGIQGVYPPVGLPTLV